MTNTITLEADDGSFQKEEGIANGAVTPGQLVELAGFDTTGATSEPQFDRNSTEGKVAVQVALELAKTGKTIADDYASGDYMETRTFQPGEEFYGLVFDGANAGAAGADLSANANISVGDRLVAYAGAGENGNLRKLDTANGDEEGAVLCRALEAVDNSGGADPARIRVEVV